MVLSCVVLCGCARAADWSTGCESPLEHHQGEHLAVRPAARVLPALHRLLHQGLGLHQRPLGHRLRQLLRLHEWLSGVAGYHHGGRVGAAEGQGPDWHICKSSM